MDRSMTELRNVLLLCVFPSTAQYVRTRQSLKSTISASKLDVQEARLTTYSISAVRRRVQSKNTPRRLEAGEVVAAMPSNGDAAEPGTQQRLQRGFGAAILSPECSAAIRLDRLADRSTMARTPLFRSVVVLLRTAFCTANPQQIETSGA